MQHFDNPPNAIFLELKNTVIALLAVKNPQSRLIAVIRSLKNSSKNFAFLWQTLSEDHQKKAFDRASDELKFSLRARLRYGILEDDF